MSPTSWPTGASSSPSIQPRADGGWVVTHQDITERETLNAQLARQNGLLKQREEELKAQNERFNAAINNMSQGMCLFDSEQRVVFANRRFAEIYGLAPEEVKPGTTLRQILTARARKRRLQQHRCRQVRRRGRRQLQPGDVADRASGRRAVHLRRAPADGRWRPGQHARGRHRAREAQRAPGCAERSLATAARRSSRRRTSASTRH